MFRARSRLLKSPRLTGALSTILNIQNTLIVSALRKDGTPAQQAGFLPSLISGRMIGAFAARLRSITPSVPRGVKLLSTLVHALRVRASDMGFRRCARAAASRT